VNPESLAGFQSAGHDGQGEAEVAHLAVVLGALGAGGAPRRDRASVRQGCAALMCCASLGGELFLSTLSSRIAQISAYRFIS